MRKFTIEKLKLYFSCSSYSSSTFRFMFLSRIVRASLIAIKLNFVLNCTEAYESVSLTIFAKRSKIVANTNSALPAPTFYDGKSLKIWSISSASISFRGTLNRHSTTANLTSSLGTSKQLKSATSRFASFN